MQRRISRAIFAILIVGAFSAGAMAQSAQVQWLSRQAPDTAIGVSWGVPWPEGTVQRDQQFQLTTAGGQTKPLQSWTLAYWPDGSIKWTGFATTADAGDTGAMTVTAGQATSNDSAVRVVSAAGSWLIDTGAMQVKLAGEGNNLIDSITIDGRQVARNGRLEAILQVGPETDYLHPSPRQAYVSSIKKVTVEQQGPVRAVVKFEGMHKAVNGSREWLPFVVRLYFYAGLEPIKVVHTITFDGDKEKDFIRGLGLVFDVPLRGGPRERTVGFAGANGGLWSEPLMTGGRGGFGGFGGRGGTAMQDPSAQWDHFKLVQPNAEGFTIVKRTNEQSSWLDAAQGKKAAGYVLVGDATGSLGVAFKDFWQSHPSALEVQGATTETATVRAWLWSPDGPAMDMRFYDTHGHGDVNGSGNYEDYEAGYDDPVGIARTSELMLFPSGQMPTREQSVAQAAATDEPPLLVVSPETIHNAGIFGLWSLPDRSTPFKAAVEDRLAGGLDYYKKTIDEHHWYGFWNYGDVRHAYDAQRHMWRYDVGGYAWDNTELGSVLWLWYSYIRTGDADIFRMAEAMTRHTSEVDTYHFGRFVGLGSRHNVVHWGDSAKEPRVSQSAHNRFYYYLTTDERVGDIMKMVLVADQTTSDVDMMRKAQPRNAEEAKYPGRVRMGPDWLAFVSNWMTEWERTGDTQWRDKIMAGVNSMAEMPYWMRTGRNLVMGYDPATGKLYQVDDTPGSYNLTTIQGGAEVAFELADLLDSPTWDKIWLQYCRLGNAPADVLLRDKETGTEGADASMVGERGSNSQGTARLAAYAYYRTKNPAFAERAIQGMGYGRPDYSTTRIEVPEVLNPVDEARGVSTNTTAQSSLMDIEILEMVKDQLPTEAPAPPQQRGFGGFGARGARGGRSGQ